MAKVFEYLKCAFSNLGTLLGYLNVLPAAGLIFLGIIEENTACCIAGGSLGFLSILPLIYSKFGRGTYQAYLRTKKHIEKFNRIDPRFTVLLQGDYCTHRGVQLAAREYGLEYKLPEFEI